jgi:ferredoxin
MPQHHHSLRFDSDKCDGCMSCMRACPTAAVRVRQGHSEMLEDRCIDCGECIKSCPRSAVVPLTDQMADLSKFDYKVAIPSPAFYAQFDASTPLNVIWEALKQCGFDDVECLSRGCDAITVATEIFLSQYRGQYPLIASFCPTVVGLIQVKYPELIDQLLPLLSPREVSAKNAKTERSSQTGLSPDRIAAVYLTPCPSKIVAIMEHPGLDRSYLDAAVSISNIFQVVASTASKVRGWDPRIDTGETASGISWSFTGWFPGTLPAEEILCVSGLPNVIRILDDIEKGKLRRYAFIECYACPEGCVSGCLTVENPYVARGKAIKLRQSLPAGPSIGRQEVEQRYRTGYYGMDTRIASRPLRPLDDDISRAIVKLKEKEKIFSELPGIDCGACGAPTCRAFAEDVVLGDQQKEACIFLWRQMIVDRLEEFDMLVRLTAPGTGGRREGR